MSSLRTFGRQNKPPNNEQCTQVGSLYSLGDLCRQDDLFGLKGCILVRLEFEIKLEPLLLYSPATLPTPATPPPVC